MERWPPIYDAEQLAGQIKGLTAQDALFDNFFAETPKDVPWCQGDVVRLPPMVPYIDDKGPAVLEGDDLSAWLLLSNTCDLCRPLNTVEWAQAVPIRLLGSDSDITQNELQALRRYQYARQFYVPDWSAASPRRHQVAELTMPVTVAREALNTATRLARLSLTSWVLLHSCLVRFLARDDGRFDPA
jgi:hypothetical protein